MLPFGRSDKPVSRSRPNWASDAKVFNLKKKNKKKTATTTTRKTQRTLFGGVLPPFVFTVFSLSRSPERSFRWDLKVFVLKG